MIDDNKDQRKEIEETAWDQINLIKEKNKEELREIIKAGMESKQKLNEVQGDLKVAQSEKEKLDREIINMEEKLKGLIDKKI